ncbi:MAG: acyl-CoA dehydrogenase family protein [Actinomycetota bacterium]|nr:acyl-CoA/acyl-ACP dehydrogenase [Acidimicrobiales bacterium]MEC7873326.1 acyl-CoA dehydrogenase family protein [Actinomycetota bacterium]MEC9339118.1 acyl-CoA dehydrogenase family protein [Actinomycetota bacterium]
MADPIQTEERMELVERIAALGPRFGERAATHDREASFPTDNWADLANEGFLGLCAPVEFGGFGGDFVTYALVSEELGRHCATTALTFNMHTATALLAGWIADQLGMNDDQQAHLDRIRPQLWEGMCRDHVIHSQPFSEGRTPGSGSPIGTSAVVVDGGYQVTGKKIFASLSGVADIHNVVALVEGDDRTRLLGVPANGKGVDIVGDWDPLGMRGTDSRDLLLTEAFVPQDNEVLPPGVFDAMAQRFPYFYMTLAFTYLGLMRAILDLTRQYLRGELGVESRRDSHVKQAGWAEMQMIYDKAQSLTYRVLGEATVDPTNIALRRAWVATVAVMEGAPEMASLAIRVCGGRSMLRPNKLEQHYRDARCGATMLPWSVEISLDRIGKHGLYDD